MENTNIRISVITVVRNDETHIEETLLSVLNQTYANIEYLVIDGKSTDNTFITINRYKDKLAYFISEKDKGIYDAMNKGILKATGDYMIFLNSGDIFANEYVVQQAVSMMQQSPRGDIFYGDVLVKFPSLGNFPVKSGEIGRLKQKMIMNHQSCFISSTIHKVRLYELNYKIAADYDFILSCYYKGSNFVKLDITVSRILAGGISDSKRAQTFRETYRIKQFYQPGVSNYFSYVKELAYFRLSSLAKKIFPQKIIRTILSTKYKIG